MCTVRCRFSSRGVACLALGLLALLADPAPGQDAALGPKFEIYGFGMLDFGKQIDRINPDYYDVVRPTQLPAFAGQYGADGQLFMGIRPSRLGVQAWFPTSAGDLFTIFEFDLFGSGAQAGQTTFHIRKVWGQLGRFGVGQNNSTFSDVDVFPNTLEFWGPNGMVLFRNVQVRYSAIEGESFLNIALERPGASADQGQYSDRIELDGIAAKFPLPDLTAQYRSAHPWGYVQLGGILRRVEWEDLNAGAIDLSGGATGWGFSLTSRIDAGKKDVVKLAGVYGEGMQNYMNDAPVDIGIQNNFSDPVQPIIGVALPMWSVMVFLDHTWSEKWTSSVGYSTLVVDNSDGQLPDAFHSGSYVAANLIYYPVPNMLAGIEYVWGQRKNNSDGWTYDDNRVAVSVKYSFSQTIGGK
ncbi:MAG TPA: DcaP family trimeric outer membrane transporter [Gemmatimonadales bacterium]|nr:DcaP family trimeric outer membrane transporter [Gemmatimonadales bacterium]